MSQTDYSNLTVVLVHAAWADGSSWNKVTQPLQRGGFRVLSAQIPLTSLTDDVAAVHRLLRQVKGTVLLAGHSYGGAVISAAATGNPLVKALVYIAAMAPDEDETVGALFHRAAPHPSAPQLAPDADGFLWLPPEAFANAVAPDATPEETALMAATQKPIALRCLEEPLRAPAWKGTPSWFLIAEKDRMLSPVTQRFMANRTSARIHSLKVDHTPLVSAPETVVRLIVEAADAIA
jgi:pimeloyl-ACP methyl ester carboxylesterase